MPKELGLSPREALAALASIPEYVRRFDEVFGDGSEVTEAHLAKALASFQRTLVSDNAPYDAFRAGDPGALSEQMQRGLSLFEEIGCDACHTPPEFQSDVYADRGVGNDDDLGRFEVTGDARDRGAFRVPGLRNVRETGPYFHDGSVATLREAVRHEANQQQQVGARALNEEELDALTELVRKGTLDIARNPDRPEQVPSGLAVPRDGFRIPR
jgi:cytochrome c peroxidase